MRIDLLQVDRFYDLPDFFLKNASEKRFGECSFSTALHGWILFGNAILHTADGGKSWSHFKSCWPGDLVPEVVLSYGKESCWIVLSRIGDTRPTHIPIARVSKNHKESCTVAWIGSTNGWYKRAPAIFFVDANNGWIVATEVVDSIEFGVIFMTRDGGRNWRQISRRTDVAVRLWFGDSGNGWQLARGQTQDRKRAFSAVLEGQAEEVLLIGGYQTSLLCTTDRGCTWTTSTKVNRDLYAFAVNGNTIVAVGERGLILRSTTGGVTWSKVLSRTREDIYSIECRSARALAVGDVGLVLFTENAGESWRKLEVDIEDSFHGIHFIRSEAGILVGPKGIYQFVISD